MFILAVISCEIFGGFSMPIMVEETMNIQDIADVCIKSLLNRLLFINLTALAEILKSKNFCIRDIKKEDLEPGQILSISSI